MPTYLDSRFLTRELVRAAQNRVTDLENQQLNDLERDLLVGRLLGRTDTGRPPALIAGSPIQSQGQRVYLKDLKYLINLTNLELNAVDDFLDKWSRESTGIVQETNLAVQRLQSDSAEIEIKTYGNFTRCHFNGFCREQDNPSNELIVDPKTNVAFSEVHRARQDAEIGIRLPVRELETISISSIEIDSDLSETALVVQSTDPNNLLSGKQFQYQVLVRNRDQHGNRILAPVPDLVLVIEFGFAQLTNSLELVPSAVKPMVVSSLQAIDAIGSTVDVEVLDLSTTTLLKLMYAPLQAKTLIVTLSATTPASVTEYDLRDPRLLAVNEVLIGVGATSRFSTPGERVQGAVYDFSIASLKVNRTTYESLGFWLSSAVPLNHPVSLELQNEVAVLDATEAEWFQSIDSDIDWYVKIQLRDEVTGRSVWDGLLPIPDAPGSHYEIFTGYSNEYRLTFFPDLMVGLTTLEVVSAVVATTTTLTVTTSAVHGFAPGEQVSFLGPASFGLNGTWNILTTPTTTSMVIDTADGTPSSLAADLAIAATDTTYPKTVCWVEANQTVPFVVWGDDTALTIGVNYEVSPDGGSTWLSSWVRDGSRQYMRKPWLAGNCLVRILDLDRATQYCTVYAPVLGQNLDSRGLFTLSSHGVLLDESLHGLTGQVQTLLVLRRTPANHFISVVVPWYALKVRENVS